MSLDKLFNFHIMKKYILNNYQAKPTNYVQ